MKVTLCTEGGCCPSVEFGKNSVKIGENGNIATLKKEEWNLLVDMVRSGKLKKV